MPRSFSLLVLLCLLGMALPPRSSAAPRAAPAALPAGDKSAPFGLVTALANRVRSDELPTAINLLREAGVQWTREEIFWDRLQPERGGPYLWGGYNGGMYNYDAAIGGLHEAGISVLGLLDYNPAWFKSKNPPLDDWIGDWGDYVYQSVARYGRDRGQIKYWEVWNEQNSQMFGYENGLYSVEDYIRVLEIARAAIKAADPSAQIVLGGLAAIWGPPPRPHDYDMGHYLQLLADKQAWGLFDVLAIHPYRNGPPELAAPRRDFAVDFVTELNTINDLNRRFGAKPIWLTELGWSNHVGGVSAEEQAATLLRMYTLALAHPAVHKVFWYDFRDDTVPETLYHQPVYNDREPEFHFGLLRRAFPLNPRSPSLRKPAFLAYRTMTEVLAGTSLTAAYKTGGDPNLPGTYAYRFDGNGRAAYVVWRMGGPSTITLLCNCRTADIRRMDGRLMGVVNTDQTVTLRLESVGMPMLVEWGRDRAPGGNGAVFAETGHAINNGLLQYWNSRGGLAQFGYPISGPLTEPDPIDGHPVLVQYFERNRLERNPYKAGTPFAVEIGRLGDDQLRRNGVDWTKLPKNVGGEGCTIFTETGQSVCAPFLDYWEQRGGLAIHGLPLTTAANENGILTQYFERGRFEYHPEHPDPAFSVQLGLLGRELFAFWGGFGVNGRLQPEPLGPRAQATAGPTRIAVTPTPSPTPTPTPTPTSTTTPTASPTSSVTAPTTLTTATPGSTTVIAPTTLTPVATPSSTTASPTPITTVRPVNRRQVFLPFVQRR